MLIKYYFLKLAICAVCRPWEALLIGFIGGAIATVGIVMEDRLCIDDPVGAFPTHALASVWGLIATGLFSEFTPGFADHSGLFKGGKWRFLGVQILATVSITLWSVITTIIQLYIVDKIFGLRMTEEDEEIGADYCVHNICCEEIQSIAATENEIIEESEGTPSPQLDRGSRSTKENSAMDCPPPDLENLREINSTHSSEKHEMRKPTGSHVINNEISLRVAPYLEQQIKLRKGTCNCGYYSA